MLVTSVQVLEIICVYTAPTDFGIVYSFFFLSELVILLKVLGLALGNRA